MMWRGLFSAFLVAAFSALAPKPAVAAQTSDGATRTTIIAMKLGGKGSVSARSYFKESPPTIMIDLPSRQVVAALPEQSVISAGAVQSISASYERFSKRTTQRYLRRISIVLAAPYTYRVRSEAGQIVVEIDHPASVGSTSVEVGLKGGTIISSLTPPVRITDRFRAMQEALGKATPVPWTMQLDLTRKAEPAAGQSGAPKGEIVLRPALPAATFKNQQLLAPRPRTPLFTARWILAAALLLFLVSAWVMMVQYGTTLISWAGGLRVPARLSSSIGMIDQLVWRAFERQGYQAASDLAVAAPLSGSGRIIEREGVKSALIILGQGPFLEKRIIEQVVKVIHRANLDRGFLAATGAFTIPAQRLAKMHRITLIGREELSELIGVGAAAEHVSRQLQRQQSQLEEALAMVRQYADELETLRKQRNEASWYLGEERARSSQMEAQLAGVDEQLARYKAELDHWQQEAQKFKKHWEESEWYLGESKARASELQNQMEAAVQAAAAGKQEQSDVLSARCDELQRALDESRKREAELEASLARLRQELGSLRIYGERRVHNRISVVQAQAEFFNGAEQPVATAAVRDLSVTGIGLKTDQELPKAIRCRVLIPGREPVESQARLVWQRAGEGEEGFLSGLRFVSLSKAVEHQLQDIMQSASGN